MYNKGANMINPKLDKVIFTVYHLDTAGKLAKYQHSSFAAAAGQASALDGITRFIDVNIEYYTADGGFAGSHSGSMYKYSKLDNQRQVCNPYMIQLVSQAGVL